MVNMYKLSKIPDDYRQRNTPPTLEALVYCSSVSGEKAVSQFVIHLLVVTWYVHLLKLERLIVVSCRILSIILASGILFVHLFNFRRL